MEGCEAVTAFHARTKPTWCATHAEEFQRIDDLRSPTVPLRSGNMGVTTWAASWQWDA